MNIVLEMKCSLTLFVHIWMGHGLAAACVGDFNLQLSQKPLEQSVVLNVPCVWRHLVLALVLSVADKDLVCEPLQ